MVTKRILQKLIFDDDDFGNMFIICAKKYGKDYLAYKRFFNPGYNEDIDLDFMVKHYDNIVRFWKSGNNFSMVVDEIATKEKEIFCKGVK